MDHSSIAKEETLEAEKWKTGLSRGYALKVKPSSPTGCNDSDTVKPKLFAAEA